MPEVYPKLKLKSMATMRKKRKIKPRDMVAVAAHFRTSAGAMDSSKKSRKKEKKLLEKQLEEGLEEAADDEDS